MIELAVTLLIGAAGVLLYVLMDSRYERRSDIGRLTDSHQGAAATGSRPSSSPSNEEPRATAAQEAPHAIQPE